MGASNPGRRISRRLTAGISIAIAAGACAAGAPAAVAAAAPLPFAPPGYAGVFGDTVLQSSATEYAGMTVWNARTGQTSDPLACEARSTEGIPKNAPVNFAWNDIEWDDIAVESDRTLYAWISVDGDKFGPGQRGDLCGAILRSFLATDPSAQVLADGTDVVIASYDAGRTWSPVGVPPALSSDGEALLASTPGGVLFGDPTVGWDRYDAATSTWNGPANVHRTYGLRQYREGNRHSHIWDWTLDHGSRQAQVLRPLDDGDIWAWSSTGRTESLTLTRDGHTVRHSDVPVPTLDLPEAANDYRVAPQCSTGPSMIPVRGLKEVVPSSSGAVLWAVTSDESSERCLAPRNFVHRQADAELAFSSDGGRSWHVVVTPLPPSEIVTVDGDTPVIQTAHICGPDNRTTILRRSGGRWRRIACEPSVDG